MDIPLTSPWSLTFFISTFAVGYYFIEIFWGEKYIYRKQLNDNGNHISIKGIHYISWGFIITILSLLFFSYTGIVQALNNFLKFALDIFAFIFNIQKIPSSIYWLIISIIFFYFLVIVLVLTKLIVIGFSKSIRTYISNKDIYDEKLLKYLGILIPTFGLIFFIISHYFGLKDFIQENYISKYIYVIEGFFYYTLILIPITSFFILKKIGFKGKIYFTIGIIFMIFGLYLLFSSIYGIKFEFINSIINYMFYGDLLGNISEIIYYIIVGFILFSSILLGGFMIDKSSDKKKKRHFIEYLINFYSVNKKGE